jgi:DNA polymerase-4
VPQHRIIFHLDMDAFYASVEQRDNPALQGKPVIVGAPPNQRGVVCAASYEARRFGVRSAMPSVTAGRLCPKGAFLYPRMSHYRNESARIMEILGRTGALIEQVSIDEAYLDVTDVLQPSEDLKEYASAVALGRTIKHEIWQERRLTATVGIAPNKLLAKIASDFNKPDGLTLVPDRDKALFLRSMPVRVLYGVGRVTEQTLRGAGIETVGDLQDFEGNLTRLVGSYAFTLNKFAHGEDNRPLEAGGDPKSISSEETFDRDTDDRQILRATLRQQANEITAELKEKNLGAHTVQVKLRYGDFTTLTRQISVEEPIVEASDIYRLGCFLLAREKLVNRPLRLIGLGVSNLGEPQARQLLLL